MLVTGAGGLIGQALVGAFVRSGALVTATDLPGLTDVVGDDSRVRVVDGDLTDDAFLDELVVTVDASNDLAVLVNCAAVTHHREGLLDTTPAMFDHLWRVNVRAAYVLTVAVARRWVERGHRGSIISVSSPGAQRAHENQALYDATKGAVEALTRATAVELGPYGIRANAITPAAVTEIAIPEPGLPLGHTVPASAVGDAAVFLASPAAAAITGHVLTVDAGLLARLRVPSRGPA